MKRNLRDWQRNILHLKNEYKQLVNELKQKPQQGTPLGNNCFKIRLSIESKGKGKSGGARVITCLQILEKAVYLLTIFDKSEKENISDKELQELINLIR